MRRFGRTHTRVLLHLTCEITALEKELDTLDKADLNSFTNYRLRRSEFYEGWDPKQKDLIEKLKAKLMEYGMKFHTSSSALSRAAVWQRMF